MVTLILNTHSESLFAVQYFTRMENVQRVCIRRNQCTYSAVVGVWRVGIGDEVITMQGRSPAWLITMETSNQT